MTKVDLSELFYSIQGEGPASGRPVMFVRFHGCNRNCLGCDEKLIIKKVEKTTSDAIISRVQNYLKTYPNTKRIVFTGGEPFLQPEAMKSIIEGLPGMQYDVETNGTIQDCFDLYSKFNLIIVSPKKDCFQTAKDRFEFFKTWDTISKNGRNNVYFKVVLGNLPWAWQESELKDVLLYSQYDPSRLWVMPAGETATKLVVSGKNTWKVAMRLGCNYSDRLHIRTGSK